MARRVCSDGHHRAAAARAPQPWRRRGGPPAAPPRQRPPPRQHTTAPAGEATDSSHGSGGDGRCGGRCGGCGGGGGGSMGAASGGQAGHDKRHRTRLHRSSVYAAAGLGGDDAKVRGEGAGAATVSLVTAAAVGFSQAPTVAGPVCAAGTRRRGACGRPLSTAGTTPPEIRRHGTVPQRAVHWRPPPNDRQWIRTGRGSGRDPSRGPPPGSPTHQPEQAVPGLLRLVTNLDRIRSRSVIPSPSASSTSNHHPPDPQWPPKQASPSKGGWRITNSG